ncbi:MAG TPA: DUF2442 domain-containing protein [Bacteroidia bacterium]|nr:DUF2442 domain-containing protein [Bacteroidia bacterium]
MPLKEVRYIRDYKLELIFNNGRKKIHDFENFLFSSVNPLVTKYRQVNLFKKVKIDSTGCISWGKNEMDLNPYDLPE